ncbi:MAG TPA: DUF6166 domain-containing protein, partial [Actinomycetota bacterium]
MKRYMGTAVRTKRGGYVVEVTDDQGHIRPLAPRNDLHNHSPDGFMWGYRGSGPAQLALALAADVLGDDRAAVQVHQALEWAMVAKWSQGAGWIVTEDDIRRVLAEIGA